MFPLRRKIWFFISNLFEIVNSISKQNTQKKMSSKWKSPFQRRKRERQQPLARASLGYLEKKKDFIQRAGIQHKKDAEIKSLERAAALRNPDEFYFSMITDTRNRSSEETKTKPFSHFTKEQRQLLQSQNIEYVKSRLVSLKRQIDDLTLNLPPEFTQPTRVFTSVEEALAAQNEEQEKQNQMINDNPKLAELRNQLSKKQKLYKDISEVYNELELQKQLKSNPNATKVEDDDGNVQYVWKTERKK